MVVRARSLILSKIRTYNKFVLDSDSALGISGTVVSEDAGIRGKVVPVRVRSPASGSTGDRWGNYCEVC